MYPKYGKERGRNIAALVGTPEKSRFGFIPQATWKGWMVTRRVQIHL